MLGRWERKSIPLIVSKENKDFLGRFKTYFEAEKTQTQDESLQKEVELLENLVQQPGEGSDR